MDKAQLSDWLKSEQQ